MPLQISRRGLIGGIATALAMPAIVKVASLMPVRAPRIINVISIDPYRTAGDAMPQPDWTIIDPAMPSDFPWHAFRVEPTLGQWADCFDRGIAAAIEASRPLPIAAA